MSSVRTALILCLGALCACEGSPGRASVEVYDAASGEPRWQQSVPSQAFEVEVDAPADVLRVSTSDYCWDSNFVMDFDREGGELLSQRKREPSASTGGGLPLLDPPTRCASGFAFERVALSSGEQVDLCGYTQDDVLRVSDVADGRERLRVSLGGYARNFVAGDQLLLERLEPSRIESYSLLQGELVWSWTAPDSYTIVAGLDAERLYLLSETSGQSHALALADGSVVWQKNLGCDSLSLAGDALVCHQTLRDSSCDQE